MTWTENKKHKPHIIVIAGFWILLTIGQALVNFLGTDRLMEYRAWEAVITHKDRQGFVPLTVWNGQATGGLAHMANLPHLARPRSQLFHTDEYGCRNPVGVLDEPVDVVILGNSFAAGSHLSEGETLADLMRSQLGLRVYNYSRINPSLLLGDSRFKDQVPQLVILFITERFKPSTQDTRPEKSFSWTPARAKPGPLRPRQYRSTRILERFETGRYMRLLTEPLYGEITWRLGLRPLPATVGYVDLATGMIFFQDGITRALDPEYKRAQTDETIEYLGWYANRITDWGSRLVVVMAPSKAAVYQDRVPILAGVEADASHEYILSELFARDIGHIPTASLFRDFRKRYPDDDLYFTDDTHMTEKGQQVILNALTQELQGVGLLPQAP